MPFKEGPLLGVLRVDCPVGEKRLCRRMVIDRPQDVLEGHDLGVEPLAKTRTKGDFHDFHRVAELLRPNSQTVESFVAREVSPRRLEEPAHHGSQTS